MMHSLRVRLMLAMAAGLAFVLTLFGVSIYALIRSSLIEELDTSLHVAAQALRDSVEVEHGRVEAREHAELATDRLEGVTMYRRLWLNGVAVEISSPSADHSSLPLFQGPPGRPSFCFLDNVDGRPLRAISITVAVSIRKEHEENEDDAEYKRDKRERERAYERAKSLVEKSGDSRLKREIEDEREHEMKLLEHDEKRRKTEGKLRRSSESRDVEGSAPPTVPLTIVVARDCAEVLARLNRLRWMLVGAGGATLVMGLLVSALMLNQGLAPMRRMATEIASIDVDDLASPLSHDGMPSELLPVVERLDALLGRLAAAINREREFAADVAHELRTPVAGLRATVEVALAMPASEAAFREALVDVLDITLQMESLIGNLLVLARLESGQIEVLREHIPLATLVDECWRREQRQAAIRGLGYDNRLPDTLAVDCDRSMLSLLFTNLLQNSVRYADQGGRVWIEGKASGDEVVVRVFNTGCRLRQEDLSHVFERFWRGDVARSEAGLHAGLGLALVKRLAFLFGGRAEATLDDGGVFAVSIAWPYVADTALASEAATSGSISPQIAQRSGN
jgi:signal transduction histidine kinase